MLLVTMEEKKVTTIQGPKEKDLFYIYHGQFENYSAIHGVRENGRKKKLRKNDTGSYKKVLFYICHCQSRTILFYRYYEHTKCKYRGNIFTM